MYSTRLKEALCTNLLLLLLLCWMLDGISFEIKINKAFLGSIPTLGVCSGCRFASGTGMPSRLSGLIR